MLVKNLWTLLVTVSFVGSFAAVITPPLWWDRITTEIDDAVFDDAVFLQTCFAAQDNDAPCTSDKFKVDFHGTQDCDGVGAHPQIKCSCGDSTDTTDQTWHCEAVPCPPVSTGCPAGGGDLVIDNDPSCPANVESASGDCSDDSVSCRYAPAKCCGFCGAFFAAHCFDGQWSVIFTECLGPPCRFDLWDNLVGTGTSCIEARTEIFKKWRGMTVVCLNEDDSMPEKDDFDRYIVLTNAAGVVTNVVFNRIACTSDNLNVDFYGTQDCDGVGAHPQTECSCNTDQIWQCEAVPCPPFPPASSGCPVGGGDIDHGNDPTICPDDPPIGIELSCTASISCSYGTEKCCGFCAASYIANCFDGKWEVLISDFCLSPSCMFGLWENLVGTGTSCIEARTEIFKEYPGMTVVCLNENDTMPEDEDFDRYIVLTNDAGVVTNVVSNTNLSP